MQTLRLIKFLVLLAVATVTAQAQLTNLNTLNGTNMTVGTFGANDFMFFYKWTGTKYVYNREYAYDFWAQYTNAPAGQFLFTNVTALQASLSNKTVARISGVSNSLAITTNLSNGVNAARLAGETSLTNLITAEAASRATASNALAAATITASNTAAANLQATNSVIAAAISGLSNSVALAVTNGGASRFSTVTDTNFGQPAIGLGQWNTTQSTSVSNINFGLGGLQILTLGNGTGLNNLSLLPTNMIDGQQVYLLVKTPSASYKISCGTPTGYTVLPSGAVVTTVSGGNTLLNWLVMSNTIIFSGGAL